MCDIFDICVMLCYVMCYVSDHEQLNDNLRVDPKIGLSNLRSNSKNLETD